MTQGDPVENNHSTKCNVQVARFIQATLTIKRAPLSLQFVVGKGTHF